MSHNFAPYQSSPPESERAKSPPLRSPTTSPRPERQQQHQHARNISASTAGSDPWAAARNQRLPSPSRFADDDADAEPYTDLEAGGPRPNDYIGNSALRGGGVTYPSSGANIFSTSLGIPLQIEACLAYLLLPPAGGVVLLLFEHQSDYVRFHAWQSSMLFSALFLLHVVFSWTSVVSCILFAGDLCLIAYLTACAWRNAETLDRVEVPFFGRLASSFVDDE